MTVSLITTKSCCGSQSLIAECSKAIRKNKIHLFRDAGYFIPDNFFDVGIFYVTKDKLTATAAYGSTKISLRCGGNCDAAIAEFLSLLNQLETF